MADIAEQTLSNALILSDLVDDDTTCFAFDPDDMELDVDSPSSASQDTLLPVSQRFAPWGSRKRGREAPSPLVSMFGARKEVPTMDDRRGMKSLVNRQKQKQMPSNQILNMQVVKMINWPVGFPNSLSMQSSSKVLFSCRAMFSILFLPMNLP